MQIDELKQSIGQEAENIIAAGIPLDKKGTKYRCFNTQAHRHGDKNPSMSWDAEALQFYCFTCGEKIDIYRYYKEFENLSHKEIMNKQGIRSGAKPVKKKTSFEHDKLTELTEKQIKYLEKRKLKQETWLYFKLKDINGDIAIPYYQDEKLTGIKIKNMKKDNPKYYSAKGSNFGLFNKDNIRDTSMLILTEGEFDSMIIHQSGFNSVVSVGTGANSLSKILKQEKNFLNKFNSLIVIGDNDQAGQEMERNFLEEFGSKVNFPSKEQFKGCKDINEVYYKYGPEQIKNLIRSASAKTEGFRDLDLDPYRGMEAVEGNYIPTGLKTIDTAINDLAPGCLTLITGRSNGGKSTLVNQIIANAIDKKNKTFLISGEGIQEAIINNLYKTVIGRDKELYNYKKINRRYFKEPKEEVIKDLRRWHKDKFILFNKGESKLKTTNELFSFLNIEVKIRRPNLLVIDNLMSVLSVEKASEKLEAQADFVQRCCDLAKAEGIHIILVLHPNKTVSKGQSMDFEAISGTSDIYNKADNILAVTRNYDEEKLDSVISGEISVLKNRYFPDLPKINTYFDEETGTLLEIGEDGNYYCYNFNWSNIIWRKIWKIDI